MIDSVLFIGAVIIAVTQAIKFVIPKVNGAVTIVVAGLLGLLVALIDTHIGVADVSVAQGILTGLAAAGVHTTASALSRGSSVPAA